MTEAQDDEDDPAAAAALGGASAGRQANCLNSYIG